MSQSSDRNLLFGILALQLNFVTRDQLVAGMHAWVLDKAKPLGEVFVDQKTMDREQQRLLDALVDKHAEKHGGDIQKSIAQLSSIDSVAAQQLAEIDDSNLHQTLQHINRRSVDAYATIVPATRQRTSSRFRIIRAHRKGGLGEVFVARDEELSREVALKEIQDKYACNEDSRQRFLREAEITGRLEHPGIVPVYGLGTYDDGRPFYAMRFIRGDSLQDAIEKFHSQAESKYRASYSNGPLSIQFRELLGRFIDVCNAIHYAHSRGVLHRDLKPGNIMLGEYGETLVVDWGLAKVVATRDRKTQIVSESLIEPNAGSGSAPTMLGSAVGTAYYMSPEQAAGEIDNLGPPADVYSLGATLYELLVGTPPFHGYRELADLIQAVRQGKLQSPRTINPAIDRSIEAICLKAMAANRARRYASPQALAEDIQAYLADEEVSAFAEPWILRARRWLRLHPALIAGCVAALTLGLVSAAVVTAVVAMYSHELSDINHRIRMQNFELASQNEKIASQNVEVQKAKLELSNNLAHSYMELAHSEGQKGKDDLATLWCAHAALSSMASPLTNLNARALYSSYSRKTFEPVNARKSYRVSSMEFLGGDRFLVYKDDSPERVHVWDLELDDDVELNAELLDASALAVDQTRSTIAVGTESGHVILFDLPKGEAKADFNVRGAITSMEFGNNTLAVCSLGNFSVWDCATLQQWPAFNDRKENIRDVVFSPSGKQMALIKADYSAQVLSGSAKTFAQRVSKPEVV